MGGAPLFGVQQVSFERDVERFWGTSIDCSEASWLLNGKYLRLRHIFVLAGVSCP